MIPQKRGEKKEKSYSEYYPAVWQLHNLKNIIDK